MLWAIGVEAAEEIEHAAPAGPIARRHRCMRVRPTQGPKRESRSKPRKSVAPAASVKPGSGGGGGVGGRKQQRRRFSNQPSLRPRLVVVISTGNFWHVNWQERAEEMKG